MYSRGLNLEDMYPGDIFTIIRWQPREIMETDGLEITSRQIEDLSYCGDLLCALAISPPYLAVEEVVSRYGVQNRVRIDARRCIMARPSEDYIEALTTLAKSPFSRITNDD
jgi:hypothetical protein